MIDPYFRSILTVLNSPRIVASHNMVFDRRSITVGYVRGDVYFQDGSLLHFREYVNTQFGATRFTYAYHDQRADGSFAFRYDNTGHFPGLPLFPHHNHTGDEATAVPQRPPTLAAVIAEIEALLAGQPLDQDE